MTRLADALRRFVLDLRDRNVPFALVGALAVSARTEPRFTRDADLAVRLSSDAEAEALISDLRVAGYEVAAVVEHVAVERLATVRLVPPFDRDLVLDLLIASSGIESEVVDAADNLEVFPGVRVPVATPGDLIALKVLSSDEAARPQDSADLRALLRAADAETISVARERLALISQRGYSRGRDLESMLAAFISRFRPDSAP
jgi:predicted nucleotidyltransferase